MKVVVLTTSYPRYEGDPAGNFVADAVEQLRERGVEVDVVSPASFRHFGIAYGSGVMGNLKRSPWKAALVPAMLGSFAQAARRAARDADLVHAHWLPSGAVALATGQAVRGAALGDRRRAGAADARRSLAACSRGHGSRSAPRTRSPRRPASSARGEVRVIPSAVELPEQVGEPAEPPEVLYVGRLSPEKGILELVQAAEGMKLTVAGDGPLRAQVPGALGFVPHHELPPLYERAAVVAVPSHREGFGVACAEAMAAGRPVVASAVGGLLDLVVDGETGLLVPPRNVGALRAALERLLGDAELRARMGAAGRERIREHFTWPAVTDLTIQAYEDALAG